MRRLWMVAALAALQTLTGIARADQDWRDVDPNDVLLIDVSYGRIAIELFPEFLRGIGDVSKPFDELFGGEKATQVYVARPISKPSTHLH